ncbi:MAG: prepilin-type N-terminal cleavage/methylation domain-containing protein [Candidatus Omnitrophica bacterium]|nr:prepilin-type N-terminal cleavage/methylation domain-containing protein [Candidatus Omnitrophota bacterium]
MAKIAVNVKKAFTIIEIIIALTILGIGIITVMSYMPVSLDASKRAADLTSASLIAQGLFEEIKGVSFDDITNADAFDTSTNFSSHADYPGFEYKVEVNPAGTANSKEIIITVRWKFHGKILTEIFQTGIAKYNPN